MAKHIEEVDDKVALMSANGPVIVDESVCVAIEDLKYNADAL